MMLREQLISAILDFLAGGRSLLPIEQVRRALEQEVDLAGPAALVHLKECLGADNGWTYYPPDPLARRIHRLLGDRFIKAASRVVGAEHLASPLSGPVVLMANHLSYADANVMEVLLSRTQANWVADRMTALAGPKVFSSTQRRFSSLCFGTVKVPQSADVSSGEARLSARDVARAARSSIAAALARLEAGDVLVVFAEGRRSRTGQMGELLPGAFRYLELPGTWVVPIGLTGSEQLYGIDSPTVQSAQIEVTIGAPTMAAALLTAAGNDRALAMHATGTAIASLVPAKYRGVYEAPKYEGAAAVWTACSMRPS
ncbi:MAG: lysophospholipid acyltransferase family protein [Vicinamibacterales bacterium]